MLLAEEFFFETPIRYVTVERPLTEETFSAPRRLLLRQRSPSPFELRFPRTVAKIALQSSITTHQHPKPPKTIQTAYAVAKIAL